MYRRRGAHSSRSRPGTPLPADAAPTPRAACLLPVPSRPPTERRYPSQFAATDNTGQTDTVAPPADLTITITPVNVDDNTSPPGESLPSGSEDALVPVALSATDVTAASPASRQRPPAHGSLYLDAARTQPVLTGHPLPAGPDTLPDRFTSARSRLERHTVSRSPPPTTPRASRRPVSSPSPSPR